ncbi:MAG: NotI family restriction endonuclease [Anaerolineales bacterium]
MPSRPLCEVFGHPINNFSPESISAREDSLCPFNNKIPRCTKDKSANPLGVCSTFENGDPIIICPIRFRENWRIINDVSAFLLPGVEDYKFLTEVTMKDRDGEEVGSVDGVLVNYSGGEVIDFGVLEIQAVYISGNIRNPFAYYMENPTRAATELWNGDNPPRPDWLSSVKRLVRQITVKGVVLQDWGKKMAIAVQRQFYSNHLLMLQGINTVSPEEADLCWYLYDLVANSENNGYNLVLLEQVCMKFDDALERFSSTKSGDIRDFTAILRDKVQRELRRNARPAQLF